MGISLDDGMGGKLAPSVKLANVGDWVVGHLVHIQPGTKTKDDGSVKKTLQLTILIKDTSEGALMGSGQSWERPSVGDEARVFVDGSTWSWWIEAKNAHGDVEVGDVLRWMFKDTTRNPTPGQSDFKNRKFDLRKPRDDEGGWVAKCEARHREIISGGVAAIDHEPADEIAF